MKSIKNNTLIWLIVTLSIIVNVICYFTIPSYHRYYYLSNSLTDDMNTTTPLTKKKLLILAYGRSGSSLLGDLMASLANSSYFFEPLYRIKGVYKNDNAKAKLLAEQRLKGIFECNPQVLTEVCSLRGRCRKKECSKADKIIIKTIRSHHGNLDPWLLKENDVKILHLVRDPRAIYYSMSQQPYFWKGSLIYEGLICQRMKDDVEFAKRLDRKRYKLLRYEELIAKPVKSLTESYKFAFGEEVADNKDDDAIEAIVKKHIPAFFDSNANISEMGIHGYSTVRNATFDPNKWITMLPTITKKSINAKCKENLLYLNYTKPYKSTVSPSPKQKKAISTLSTVSLVTL